MALTCSFEYMLKVSQGLAGVLGILTFFLPRFDLRGVYPRAVSWYLDCYRGRKYYRVGFFPCELELSLQGPIFRDGILIRTLVPGAQSCGISESFRSWLTPYKCISCLTFPMAIA